MSHRILIEAAIQGEVSAQARGEAVARAARAFQNLPTEVQINLEQVAGATPTALELATRNLLYSLWRVMPDTFWLSDMAVRSACEALHTTPERLRQVFAQES